MFATTVEGAPQLINRLRGFNDDVYKALQRDIKSAADLIGSSARGLIPGQPASNWSEGGRLGWAQGKVVSSIKPRFRSRSLRGTRYVMGVVDISSPAGALYTLAGSKTSSQFGDLMNANWGTTYPRALGPAWTMHVDEARDQIQQAVDNAARKVAF